jgi:hypothetical protein
MTVRGIQLWRVSRAALYRYGERRAPGERCHLARDALKPPGGWSGVEGTGAHRVTGARRAGVSKQLHQEKTADFSYPRYENGIFQKSKISKKGVFIHL